MWLIVSITDMPFTNHNEHVPYNWDNILDFSDVQNSDMSGELIYYILI